MTATLTQLHPAKPSRDTNVPTISPAQLRREVLDADEIAVVDVREGERYATGHISVAVELPFSEIELRAGRLLPRRTIRIVVTDDDGLSLAPAAATRLRALGYPNVRVLAGGVQGWAEENGELITGLNSLSKALGEFVERNDHTPKITAVDLQRALEAGEKIVVLDTRPLEEFTHISIPTGLAAPGAELLYRAFDAVPSPEIKLVINCAGRTRAIIGAQALRNAGFPNPVVSLENGTAAWLLAGYEPVRGATAEAARPTEAGLAKAREGAALVADRFGVRTLARSQLDEFAAESADRTLYLFDVRTPEEYAAGHVRGALSAPGGQLVQATDRYIAARQARVVLVDDPDLIRATITASWLIQLGLAEVYVYPASDKERTERGAEPKLVLGAPGLASAINPADLAPLVAQGGAVLDLEGAPPYFRPRRYIPGSIVARRSTVARHLDKIPGNGAIILTSNDGILASFAAAELGGRTRRRVVALTGGTAAWIEAGLGTPGEGLDQPSLDTAEALPRLPTLEERRINLAAYVAWGDRITGQLARDGLVQFRAFNH